MSGGDALSQHEPIRWGILSTASIAHGAFLPALRAAGGGRQYAVGGRDLDRTRAFAAENEIEIAREGYQSIIDDDQIDAIYIPLPNSMHAEWTLRALEAEKVVLCEKPLCGNLADATRVLSAAHDRGGLLWEAFVFPFREQSLRIREILDSGRIGELREIYCSFHFTINGRDDIRLSPGLEGGALRDVGCYPISFARYVFRSDADGATATARLAPEGVDIEMSGLLTFPHDRQLLFSCGMERGEEKFCRIVGTAGEIRLSNPFHPNPGDTMELRLADGTVEDCSTANNGPTFTEAVQHIHNVLWCDETPRHLATEDALGNAVAIDLIERSSRSGRMERV
jgi:predicted dehydrogenase